MLNWLDIALLILAGAGLIKGWRDGFVRQAVALTAFAAAIYLCSEVADSIRTCMLQQEWFAEQSVTVVSHLLAFLLIAGLVLLTGWVIHKMISITPLSLPNRIAGSIFGFVTTVFLLSLTLILLETVDPNSRLISLETRIESRFYLHVKAFAPAVYPADLLIWR
jgi:membrane protein required for colicin V production